jgi:hypothetical protein
MTFFCLLLISPRGRAQTLKTPLNIANLPRLIGGDIDLNHNISGFNLIKARAGAWADESGPFSNTITVTWSG